MELLYVWIEEYNNIKEQGFNFSPKHKFEFKPTAFDENRKVTGGTLTHDDINPDYPNNFFGEHISNITAIVGKNGSGKSSLVKFILDGDSIDSRYLFLYRKDSEIICKCTNIKHISSLISYMDGDTFRFKKSIIYFSPLITSNSNFLIESGFKNISSAEVLYESANIISDDNKTYSVGVMATRSYHPIMATYSMLEMSRQIKFLNQISNTKLIPFTPPEDIEISMPIKECATSSIRAKEEELVKELLINVLRFIIEKEKNKEGSQNTITSNYFLTIDEQIEELCMDLRIGVEARDEIMTFFEFLSTIAIKIKTFDNESSATWNVERTEIPELILNKDNYKSWKEWINKLGISFVWRDISDGEASLLSLMARLWDAIEESKEASSSDKGSYIIILDEFEVGFHPEWQKESIERLLSFFKIFDSKFHLIITTHSPIILSDIPNDNIIYLENEKYSNICKVSKPKDMERTFGANIYNLYRSSFFMNGLMGTFAKEKIDGVIKDLRGVSQIAEKRRYVILLI